MLTASPASSHCLQPPPPYSLHFRRVQGCNSSPHSPVRSARELRGFSGHGHHRAHGIHMSLPVSWALSLPGLHPTLSYRGSQAGELSHFQPEPEWELTTG